MKYASIAIGTLEKRVKTLAKKLEKEGFTVELDVFRTGPGGDVHYGVSYVELDIEKEDQYMTLKFIANGYGPCGSREYGGTTWTNLKAGALADIRDHWRSK